MLRKVAIGGWVKNLKVKWRFLLWIRPRQVDGEAMTTIATTKVQQNELEDLGEGGPLFHLWMWVKGAPLHLIVDIRSQKNLVLVCHQEVAPVDNTTPTVMYTIELSCWRKNLNVNQQCHLP